MSAVALRYPPLPTYDPDSGANRFAWVLDSAARVRTQRQVIDDRRWAEREQWRREARKVPQHGNP